MSEEKKVEVDKTFKYQCHIKESHNTAIYGIKFFPYGNKCSSKTFAGPNTIFATVGSNRTSIYKCMENGEIKCIQIYVDEAWDEV